MKIKSTILSFLIAITILTCSAIPALGFNDYGITAIIQPTCSAAVPGTLHPVIVVITNFGTTSQTSIPVSYTVTGSIPVTVTYIGFLAPGTSDTFDISVPGFVVPNGAFTFCAYTEGDSTPANDTTCISCNGNPMSIDSYLDNSKKHCIISPNPSSGFFSLKLADQINSQTTITITDLLGRKVMDLDFTKPEINVDLSNESSGLYLIILKTPYAVSTSKLFLIK